MSASCSGPAGHTFLPLLGPSSRARLSSPFLQHTPPAPLRSPPASPSWCNPAARPGRSPHSHVPPALQPRRRAAFTPGGLFLLLPEGTTATRGNGPSPTAFSPAHPSTWDHFPGMERGFPWPLAPGHPPHPPDSSVHKILFVLTPLTATDSPTGTGSLGSNPGGSQRLSTGCFHAAGHRAPRVSSGAHKHGFTESHQTLGHELWVLRNRFIAPYTLKKQLQTRKTYITQGPAMSAAHHPSSLERLLHGPGLSAGGVPGLQPHQALRLPPPGTEL